ncbi:MAG: hypothetical protein C0201_03350 [Caldisphaera sp.]|nr:MAG: hypothetical protein C0201_03350 [Caldisphaera sp.]
MNSFKCPYCGYSPLVSTPDGKLVCPNCGSIVSENLISEKSEWSKFNEKGMQNTKGVERASEAINSLRHDMGIGDLSFEKPKKRNYMKIPNRTLIKNIRHAVSRDERPQIDLFSLANKAASTFDLSRGAKDTLADMLHNYIDKNAGSYKDKSAIVAAAFSKVVEIYNLNISQSEIEEYFNIDNNKLWEGKKKLNELGIFEKYLKNQEMIRATYQRTSDRYIDRVLSYVNRIISDLNLPQDLAIESIRFVRESISSGKTLYGKRPEAIAAASVYLISRLNNYDISQKEIANSVSIKESTVRKLYKFLITNMAVIVSV